MTEVLTPAKFVLITLYLTIDEVDMDAMLAHAGVPPQRIFDENGVVSANDVLLLARSALELTGDPALGLHLGQEFGIEMLDLVGMMLSAAPDAGTAMQIGIQYSQLVSTLGSVELIEEGDRVRLVLHLIDDLLTQNTYYFVEFAAAAFFCISRRVVDGEFFLRRITTRHPAPAWQNEYAQVFGEEVEFIFDAAEDSLEFDRALLELPMARHSPGLYRHLREEAARRLASRPQPESASASVQRLIDEHLGQRLIDLPLIAEHMGVNPRTLQRRLKEEKTSFHLLHDACRFRRAREQLLHPDTSIEVLAASLGYSEPANFYRAFKTWSGQTPSEYRRQHKPGQ